MAEYSKNRKLHKIKLKREFADDVLCGNKCFEVRENDRGYQKGDLIQFKVVDSMTIPQYHELNEVIFEITYVLSGWGIKDGYVVFGIRRADNKRKKGRSNKLTSDDPITLKAVEMYNNGASLREIAAAVGLCDTTIRYRLLKTGVSIHRKKVSDEIFAAIKNDYFAGMPITHIALKYNLTRRTIYNYIKEGSWDKEGE